MTNNIEILAPCGSFDILKSAILAGADACYIGGTKFGARAYADNLSFDQISQAIDFAHIHGKKIYLTVNTLIKNEEMKNIYEYLLPYYKEGIDALIIQDLGLFSYVKNAFPDLNLHCSTQMNITSYYAASFMKNLGASRIVTAREMTFDEIRKIKDNVDVEIESFVHGAMCYSYSGQCLLSSLAGGRSGNRGRCAQPCRKCYNNEYLLSMKDMCTLEILPEIIDSGVDSLKIEGRMKNEYYVASAVSAYKEIATDIANGCFDINKAKAYKFKLANIFNRGGFCQSFYDVHNNESKISRNRPNNQGVLIGSVIKCEQGKVNIRLANDLYIKDVLEISLKDKSVIEITSNVNAKAFENVWLNAPKSKLIKANSDVYRTRCNKILDEVTESLSASKIMINGKLSAKVGEALSLTLSYNDYEITCESDEIIECSTKYKADANVIADKLKQTGNTEFSFIDVKINVDEDCFIPASMIKQIRRKALDMLKERISLAFKRNEPLEDLHFCGIGKIKSNDEDIHRSLKVGIKSIEQLKTVLEYDNIYGIYLDRNLYIKMLDEGLDKELKSKNIKLYIELPNCLNGKLSLKEYLQNIYFDGIYIRNIDELAWDEFGIYDKTDVVIGSSLYCYNDLSNEFLCKCINSPTIELSKELNKDEISRLNIANGELTIYEYQQVMISKTCVNKNLNKCTHNNPFTKITDDMGNAFYCKSVCDECINLIYNGVPLNLFDVIDDIHNPNIRYYRINFTFENSNEIRKIMDCYYNQKKYDIKSTRGHIYRGVE